MYNVFFIFPQSRVGLSYSRGIVKARCFPHTLPGSVWWWIAFITSLGVRHDIPLWRCSSLEILVFHQTAFQNASSASSKGAKTSDKLCTCAMYLPFFLRTTDKLIWFDGIHKHGASGYGERMATLNEDIVTFFKVQRHHCTQNWHLRLYVSSWETKWRKPKPATMRSSFHDEFLAHIWTTRDETRRDEMWFVPWWGTVGKKRRGCQPLISWRGKQGCNNGKEIIVNDDGETTCPFRLLGHASTSWKNNNKNLPRRCRHGISERHGMPPPCCVGSSRSDSEALISLIQSSSLCLKMLIPLSLLSDRACHFLKTWPCLKKAPMMGLANELFHVCVVTRRHRQIQDFLVRFCLWVNFDISRL